MSYLRGVDVVPIDGVTPSAEEGYAFVADFDAVNQVVIIGMTVPIGAVQNIQFAPTYWGQTYGSGGVYIESPASINGDYMRGQYLNVYLSNNSTAPVECLAFNVNYEPTKLDHSLSQNA